MFQYLLVISCYTQTRGQLQRFAIEYHVPRGPLFTKCSCLDDIGDKVVGGKENLF